jgi:3',5'-cyclic AMP phosphodiesterase CpdA
MFVDRLLEEDIDHVVVTGDVTHRGRESEYEAFLDAFAPLFATGRLTVIPGNHDRPGDDVADSIMLGQRVQVDVRPGLFMVRVDSTGPHNRHVFRGHGMLTDEDLAAIDLALDEAPDDHLVCLLMHHHPYPLPEEGPLELLSSWVGLPYASELDTGHDVMRTVQGRCDLLLHGHRHVPHHRVVDRDPLRPLHVYNAGSSVDLGWVRIFEHRDGELTGTPTWMQARPTEMSRPYRSAVAYSAA